MSTRSAIARQFIYDEISRALSRHDLAHNNPLRHELEKDAVIEGVREAVVRIRDERNGTVMIDDRIRQLKDDRRFRACFPTDPPRVARSDMANLRENFDAIATGKVTVE
jgi:hypothetical protein